MDMAGQPGAAVPTWIVKLTALYSLPAGRLPVSRTPSGFEFRGRVLPSSVVRRHLPGRRGALLRTSNGEVTHNAILGHDTADRGCSLSRPGWKSVRGRSRATRLPSRAPVPTLRPIIFPEAYESFPPSDAPVRPSRG